MGQGEGLFIYIKSINVRLRVQNPESYVAHAHTCLYIALYQLPDEQHGTHIRGGHRVESK